MECVRTQAFSKQHHGLGKLQKKAYLPGIFGFQYILEQVRCITVGRVKIKSEYVVRLSHLDFTIWWEDGLAIRVDFEQ